MSSVNNIFQEFSPSVDGQHPYIKIVEQPTREPVRFRYECEARSTSIPGSNSTPKHKTFPTIEIVGYKGPAIVVASCFTKDKPYRPHPHKLVGKECKNGVYSQQLDVKGNTRVMLKNVGIECVKRMDFEKSLKVREKYFNKMKTFDSLTNKLDVNAVRLCFHVHLGDSNKGDGMWCKVVTDPILDKRGKSDLIICRLSQYEASVGGNTTVILLCEKINKDDICVRFFEEQNGAIVWQAYATIASIHKQVALAFVTPQYHNLKITEPVKVFVQLVRPSDQSTSETVIFEYKPDGMPRKPLLWSQDVLQKLNTYLPQQPDFKIQPQIFTSQLDEQQQQPWHFSAFQHQNEQKQECVVMNQHELGQMPLQQQYVQQNQQQQQILQMKHQEQQQYQQQLQQQLQNQHFPLQQQEEHQQQQLQQQHYHQDHLQQQYYQQRDCEKTFLSEMQQQLQNMNHMIPFQSNTNPAYQQFPEQHNNHHFNMLYDIQQI